MQESWPPIRHKKFKKNDWYHLCRVHELHFKYCFKVIQTAIMFVLMLHVLILTGTPFPNLEIFLAFDFTAFI